MLGLVFALHMEEQGFGVFGESLFWNTSPLLLGGGISSDFGWWVREEGVSTGEKKFIGTYSSELVVSCRFSDQLEQGVEATRFVHYLNTTFKKQCRLAYRYEAYNLAVKLFDLGVAAVPSVVAVDTEGRLVQETRFAVTYGLEEFEIAEG